LWRWENVFYYTGVRTGPSPVTKSSFKEFMATIANASLLSDFELQREQELAKARAIQIGMLPQGALRTADRAVCYSFHPFHEVGGDFLDFFTLTDGAIGIYLGGSRGSGFRRNYTQRWLWGPCAARHRGDGGASAAVGGRKSGAGSSWHPTRNVPRNQIRQRDSAIGTRQLGIFQSANSSALRACRRYAKTRGKIRRRRSAATNGGGGQLLVRPTATG
jgi:hypothetical protein